MSDGHAIPMLDLDAQYAPILHEVRAALDRVLATHRYIGGPEVEGLESEIAAYCQVPQAVGVSSGTDALLISLMALGIGPGDEVITTPFTFFATAGAVWRSGARLRFVDIDPLSFNIDLDRVAEAITERTRAIIPVHLFGRCVDVGALRQIIGDRPIAIIEDCAQAIGAEHDGHRAGSLGELGAFSFFPSKNLGGIADGGLVTCHDPALAARLRQLRNHGQGESYRHALVGGNFRLDAINAAVLRAKLPHLDAWTEGRRRNAALYRERIHAAGLDDGRVQAPQEPPGEGHRHIYNQFVCRCQRRDELLAALQHAGIGCAVYYPLPLHLQDCFAALGYAGGSLPQAEAAAAQVLALPVYAELGHEQIDRVVNTLRSVYN